MTKKVRAERELRRRTKELIDVNDQLRRINRELEDVKDRYSDLYQNAPAMYFSLDARRDDRRVQRHPAPRRSATTATSSSAATTGRSSRGDRRPHFDAWFEELKPSGRVELESRWIRHDGSEIDVWFVARPSAAPTARSATRGASPATSPPAAASRPS